VVEDGCCLPVARSDQRPATGSEPGPAPRRRRDRDPDRFATRRQRPDVRTRPGRVMRIRTSPIVGRSMPATRCGSVDFSNVEATMGQKLPTDTDRSGAPASAAGSGAKPSSTIPSPWGRGAPGSGAQEAPCAPARACPPACRPRRRAARSRLFPRRPRPMVELHRLRAYAAQLRSPRRHRAEMPKPMPTASALIPRQFRTPPWKGGLRPLVARAHRRRAPCES